MSCSPFDCAGVVFSPPLRRCLGLGLGLGFRVRVRVILQRYRFCTESLNPEILKHYIE